jgi:hypothetical protein
MPVILVAIRVLRFKVSLGKKKNLVRAYLKNKQGAVAHGWNLARQR